MFYFSISFFSSHHLTPAYISEATNTIAPIPRSQGAIVEKNEDTLVMVANIWVDA